MINDKLLLNFQNIIQYKFKNLSNLQNSLIHPSILIKKNKSKTKNIYEFERLEFLGDRVLGLVIATLIFNKFKNYNEGNLSKKFSFLVQRDFLYKIALEIKLEKFLKYKKQKNANLMQYKSIFADSLESIIGSIYVDGGYNKSYKFINNFWSPYLNEIISNESDPKSELQEISQKKYKILPEYKVIKKEGMSHSPQFTISLNALKFKNIQTKGSSIQEAEKKAAKKVLGLLNEK